jgi:hypothetical protein
MFEVKLSEKRARSDPVEIVIYSIDRSFITRLMRAAAALHAYPRENKKKGERGEQN